MKVKELLELLKGYSPEEEVRIVRPTHDYWGRNVVVSISNVAPVTCTHSTYHDELVVCDDEEHDDIKTVLTIE